MEHDPVDITMPLDPDEHAQQIAGLAARVTHGTRVVDLGAGLGRIAIPLAESGADVLAVDVDANLLDAVAQSTSDLARPVRTVAGNICDTSVSIEHPEGPTELALILGNTLALVHDVMDAVALFERVRSTLATDGVLAIDHAHTVVGEEVADGNWQTGVSDDRAMQLVWGNGDAVIALRTGASVDPSTEELTGSDTPMRLWSLGSLRLLARASGFSDPECVPGEHLVLFRPA